MRARAQAFADRMTAEIADMPVIGGEVTEDTLVRVADTARQMGWPVERVTVEGDSFVLHMIQPQGQG